MTGKVLLLGMVYSNQTKPMRGQEYRDRVRCEALKSLGYEVYTLDDKHNSDNLPNHVMANFNNHRVMMKSIKAKWGDIQFDAIMLDYFFSPVISTVQ